MLKKFTLLIAFFVCTIYVAAQNCPNPIWLTGAVCFQDSTNYPYEVILEIEGRIIAKQTFNKGAFTIKASAIPTTVSVNALGHSSVQKNLSQSKTTHKNDTIIINEPFTLEYTTHVLNEVVVTAQKVKIQEEGLNYTISNIQGSDLADAGTMIDMMALST